MLGERPITLDGIGQTIEVTVEGRHLPPVPLPIPLSPEAAVTGTPGTPVTAIAIPYFQWDNRDGRAMRVWMPRADG